MSTETELSADDKLVTFRPKVEFHCLLQVAGATKDVFTMKEVMFYLCQYIIQKQLYDRKQQHIVHCSQDPLGRVLGVDSFSVKEPRVWFSMIMTNLVAVKSQDPPPSLSDSQSNSQVDGRIEEPDPESRSSSPDRKRRRSDSCPLTFGQSLSWRAIGGLGSGRSRDRHDSSTSSESQGTSGRSEVTVQASDSNSDNFSVEFEVESADSDDYDEDDASLSADDQDPWRSARCDELNPPLPRPCLRCWMLHHDWLPDASAASPAPSGPTALPVKLSGQSEATEAAGSDVEENDGVGDPDGKRSKTPLPPSQRLSDSASSSLDSASSAPHSQNLLCSQPSSSFSLVDSQELLPSSLISSSPPPTPAVMTSSASVPDLERTASAERRAPESHLDPCVVCQSRPKNGCIVHGRTGHLMSCYVCARKLKKRNKLCPVCRLPIQSVVLIYLS